MATARQVHSILASFREAITRAFKKTSGWPQFKKKRQRDGFRFSYATQFSAVGRGLYIQGIRFSKIAMRERIRFNGTVKSVSIKYKAGKWYATFLVQTTMDVPLVIGARKPIVGVDLGIKSLAVLSSGEVFANPKALYDKQRLLARRQRQLSRKKKGSNRREVAKKRVDRIHKKVADVRSAAQHKLTTYLVKNYDTVVIEDLNVIGMLRNRKLSKAITDASFGELRRQLAYKADWSGRSIIVADRFFPSSKTCSKCGEKKEVLLLSERVFNCPCGHSMDRDLNAAMNLETYGRHQIAGDLKRTEEGARATDDAVNGGSLTTKTLLF